MTCPRRRTPMKAQAPRQGADAISPRKAPPSVFKNDDRLGLRSRRRSAALQFVVLASRIELEYGLPVSLRAVAIPTLRPLGPWPKGAAGGRPSPRQTSQHMAPDNDARIRSNLTRLQWDIDRVER